jgi:glyoxylase-like metal-dependent hydrolase (beta-lactamase superfamily II)
MWSGWLQPCSGYRIHWLRLGPMDNLVYLLEDTITRRAAVIDPAWDIEAVTDLAERLGLKITDALITHAHDDHVNGLDALLRCCSPCVHLSRTEAGFWRDGALPVTTHDDGGHIQIGALELELALTPGHSPGSACYAANGALFTGDTLFVFGCGRCDLPGGDARVMYRSLERLKARFAGDTLVLPGHHYAEPVVSTMREQRWGNPFLHCADEDDFVAFRGEHNRHRHPPYEPVPVGISAW